MRSLDPGLGEGPDEASPVERIEEIVGAYVVRELSAVR